MQLPITIELHRSFFLGLGVTAMHAVVAVIVCFPAWQPWLKDVLLGGVAGSAWFSWRMCFPVVRGLRLFDNGRLEFELPHGLGWEAADLLPGATVHPWLSVIRLQLTNRKTTLALLPDSMPEGDYRRLRVWLRWRAEFSAGKGVV